MILYKKEAMEQYEKGFQKAIRQVGFFVKDLDLGLFNPFKDVMRVCCLMRRRLMRRRRLVIKGRLLRS